jgi:hypothetical protein
MLAFVHVAKTGGKTIETMLRSSFGSHHCDGTLLAPRQSGNPDDVSFIVPKYRPDDMALLKNIMPGMKSICGHNIALWSDVEDVFPDTKYFLLLRDPIKRGASHYQFHVNNDDYTKQFGFKHFSWEKWVQWETHHNHQVKMLSPNVDVDEAIRLLESKNVFIGLMENFDESLVMMKKLFYPELNIAYRRENTANENNLAKKLLADPKSRQQIKEMYAKEFPLYDYVKNEIYAKYKEEYGPTLAEDVAQFQSHGRNQINRLNIISCNLYRGLVFKPRLKKHRGIYY